jgi:hypothetical protein
MSDVAVRHSFLGRCLMRLSASGHDFLPASILYGPHRRGFNRRVFVVHSLQFDEDGRKIALYFNTLPGSFLLLREVVG